MATFSAKKEARDANLALQLEEIELLQSMYDEEFVVEDQTALLMIRTCVKGTGNEFPKSLTLSVRLEVESTPDILPDEEEGDREEDKEMQNTDGVTEVHRIEVFFILGPGYPSSERPQVNVRSNELSRHTHDVINEDLREFLTESLETGETCLMQAIQWVADEGGKYFPLSAANCKKLGGDREADKHKFCRMWLYMHHIYSKTKRRNILQLAKEYGLSGFCLPGKPGVVCTEGLLSSVTEYYLILRSWNWKSINCRRKEMEDCPSSSSQASCDGLRKVEGFQELCFDTHGHRSNHMDMGQFRAYLESRKLEYAFKFLFGIETVDS